MKPKNISAIFLLISAFFSFANGEPRRILFDTDVDTDDLFALLYLLKVNRSEFNLEAITINGNSWSNAGHGVNQIYDILYMMGRDDIVVGVGGDGGITPNGTILPNVGGYHSIVDQELSTAGNCRYRQAIPVGQGGLLDIDTNRGVRRQFLPQGRRKYTPLQQPSVQQVLTEKVSQGPITILMSGTHTGIGIFLMNNPNLKRNVEHIYIMGGGVRASNPTDCCPDNSTSCPGQCGDKGNLFSNYKSNPYAEFNFFVDPFAAYQVIHSGIPVTMVPLDATNTIPFTEAFFDAFSKMQATYEAQYCYQSLKITRDTWFDDKFYSSYFMWDSFFAGVAIASMRSSNGENEFAEMEFMNITVITSNEPYGVDDGSNPFFANRTTPRFNLQKNGVHSGHLQTELHDPFCIAENGKGKCMEGYTKEVTSSEGVRVLVATKAKASPNKASKINKAYYETFLKVLNSEEQTGRFNFSTQYPYYKPLYYKPEIKSENLGKPVIIDMDMSAGDFLALFYLLKVPRHVIDLKAVIVGATGWANAATIDIVYDVLHMMGRDDIPVGLGDVFATNQSDPITFGIGKCTYSKAIPMGSGGFIDSDTLYGLARRLPRSPRRYTAENSVKDGAPRDTDNPELRQPSAVEVWNSVTAALSAGEKLTVLANGPLTNIAKIIKSSVNGSSSISEVYVVGGNVGEEREMNMFLDPAAAKEVFESSANITMVPLAMQRKVSFLSAGINSLRGTTPEASFCRRLLKTLDRLRKTTSLYSHVDMFLGEVAGAAVAAGVESTLETTYEMKFVKVAGKGDGLIVEDDDGKKVKVLSGMNTKGYFKLFAERMEAVDQSAKIGSFEEQTKVWKTPPHMQ